MADPYTPQTTPAGPSPQAVAGLGGALENLGLMIAGKLDQAEMASQYNNGQEILRRNLNQFELNLQSDPNWQEYPAKLAAAEAEWWTQIDGVVKHQGAKNALQQWWMSARDSAEARVGQAQLNVRGNAILGTFQQNRDALSKDTTLDPAAKKARYEEMMRPLVQSLLIDPQAAENDRQTFYHATDVLAASDGAWKAMQPTEPGGQPDYAAAHAYLAKPENTTGLTETEVATLDGKITTQEKVGDYHNTQANAKAEVDLTNAESDVLVNNGSLPKFQDAINKAQFVGTTQQQTTLKLKWAKEYDALVDELSRRTSGGAYNIPGDADNTTLNDYLYRATDPSAPNTEDFFNKIVDEARKSYHFDHTITDTQLNKVISAAKPRTDSRMARYDALFAVPAGSDQPTRIGYIQGKADFMTWVNNNAKATDAEMEQTATMFKERAANTITLAALNTYLAATQKTMAQEYAASALRGGTAVVTKDTAGPPPPAAPVYPQPLVDKLKLSKVSVTSSFTSGGRTYYIASDGKQYQVVGGVVAWWDGKTWQPLK